MLSREEFKQRNTKFWTKFRTDMRKVPGSDGRSLDWIKYPLRVKDIYLRLEADGKGARMCLDIQPKDDGIRSLFWEQMVELRVVMEQETGPANWNEFHRTIGDRNVSRIEWSNPELNFYKDEDWKEIQRYLHDRLTGFDRFYSEYQEILIALAE